MIRRALIMASAMYGRLVPKYYLANVTVKLMGFPYSCPSRNDIFIWTTTKIFWQYLSLLGGDLSWNMSLYPFDK